MLEFFKLVGIRFAVFFREVIESVKIAKRYYRNRLFFRADIALKLLYFFHNPFSISKRFLQERGEKEVYAYGETPLTSWEIIARESGITAEDTVYELGSGRGRG